MTGKPLKMPAPLHRDQVAAHLNLLETQGFTVVPGFLVDPVREVLRRKLQAVLDAYVPMGSARSHEDRYLIHDLLARDRAFGGLLDDVRLQQLVAPVLGDHWVMYAFTSSSLPPGGTNYGRRLHVDSPRFCPSYVFNVGMIWTLDAFTRENGGTEVLPGSHLVQELPDESQFERGFRQVECPAGSLILFNARLAHRSGVNGTGQWRHALTLNACRSFMKQRMDWVRFLPREISDALGPQARRLIGFSTRVPTSMEEFFLPEEERLYRPGQG